MIPIPLVQVLQTPVAWRLWFIDSRQIFFAPETGTVNYSDTLIRLFPEKFWNDAALTISGLVLIGGLLIAFIGWAWSRRVTQTANLRIATIQS